MDIFDLAAKIFLKNGLVFCFLFVGIIIYIAYFLSKQFTKGRIHGSAIAILLGLILAYIGGYVTFDPATGEYGKHGLANIPLFAGMALMGGGMLRDFAIIATAFGAKLEELKKAGLAGFIALVVSTIISFVVGVVIAYAFGYTNPVDLTTIGAGTITFIVGPVTGTALGASSEIIALSIAAGLVKSVTCMILTPLLAKAIGLDNPQSAVIYGGLIGSTSGVAAGLAATDEKLIPYGAMVATFYTGFGCLVAPSVLYLATAAIFAV